MLKLDEIKGTVIEKADKLNTLIKSRHV
jgi:hypothetical protein